MPLTVDDAAKILRLLSYIKLDMDPFLIVSKQDKIDPEEKLALLHRLGDAVYFPELGMMLGELSASNLYLRSRNDRRKEVLQTTNGDMKEADTIIALDMVREAFAAVGMEIDTSDKIKLYFGKNQLSQMKNHEVTSVRDLYSHIIRAASSGGRRPSTKESWG